MEFKPYDPKAIEPKWQKRWADSHVFEAKNDYDIFAAIESLAGLHQRGILTDEEFATKKAELLGRL